MENWLDILARSVAGGGVSRRTTLRAMGAGLVAALLRSPASSYAGNSCDPNPCGPHSICDPVAGGGHRCRCQRGYTRVNGTCKNVNECREHPGICGPNAVCVDTDGGFRCRCKKGFRFNGTMSSEFVVNGTRGICVDIDECAENPGICGNGTCVNTEGSYDCDCDPGYVFYRGTCVPVSTNGSIRRSG